MAAPFWPLACGLAVFGTYSIGGSARVFGWLPLVLGLLISLCINASLGPPRH